jgi:hypothetical protein
VAQRIGNVQCVVEIGVARSGEDPHIPEDWTECYNKNAHQDKEERVLRT